MKILSCSLLAILITGAGLRAQNVVYDANAEVRKVGSFNGVSVGSGIALYLSQGSEQAVAVSAEDPKYVERIITEIKDGTLRIRVDGKMWNNWNWGNKKLKAYVTVTDLNYLGVSGGSVAKLIDKIKVNDLESDISGGSILEGDISGNNLNVDLSGGSIGRLSGDFSHAKIEASGGSIFKDFDFGIGTCQVEASGGSIINVSINKELNADASGGSIINYKGPGVITSVGASGGSIIKKKD